MGAPLGNQNAAKGKQWTQAIRKALARHSGESASKGLEMIAEKLIAAAENGDPWAIKELGDRVEGKTAQSVTLSGDEDNPINTKWTIEIVHTTKDNDSDSD